MTTQCPKCNTENPNKSKFCSECATPLQPPMDTVATKTMEIPFEEFTRGTTFADRYEIIETLGKGGMGTVYRVEDTKVGQDIALKLIKPEIASDKKTIERFRNELKTTRMISHRNVCRMFDLGDSEGTYFITMEYIPGEDLKSFIRRVGLLPSGKAVSITKQVCEGLAEAHRLGVVHRDLKSSNIMIDKEGNARIMDFGIASSLRNKGLTGEGIIIGTPEYMSPEQAEAKEVDHRSDIYSLGVILYEMVTGKLPFEGDTPLSIVMKHKGEIPKNPKELNPLITEHLDSLIIKCLEKEKEKRFQNTTDLLSELKRIEKTHPKRRSITERFIKVGWKKSLVYGGGVIALLVLFILAGTNLFIRRQEPIDSIAVLPLENFSADPEQEYFVDGMTDALISQLSQIGALRVISRTSIMMYKEVRKPLPEIARELNVDVVVEGTVVRDGERVRITAKLIEATAERNLWAKDYERSFDDILELQKNVAEDVAKEINVILTPDEKARLADVSPVNPKAFEAFLRGRHFLLPENKTLEGFRKGLDYLQQAIEIDPDYALAYAELAYAYGSGPSWGFLTPMEAFPKQREAALKALKLDESLAETHLAISQVKLDEEWDWESAIKEVRRTIELKPGFARARHYYAHLLSGMGRHEEAIAEAKQTLELDPISESSNCELGRIFYLARQYDQAINQLQITIELFPTSPMAHTYLCTSYLEKCMFDEAKEAIQNTGPIASLMTAYTYARMGKKEEARMMVNEMIKIFGDKVPTWIALVYAHLDEKDKAFEWLQKGFDNPDFLIRFMKVEPVYDPLRSDKRFEDLLRRMNFRDEE